MSGYLNEWDAAKLHEIIAALETAIQTAIDKWPGEAHLGTSYYTLVDSVGYDPRAEQAEAK